MLPDGSCIDYTLPPPKSRTDTELIGRLEPPCEKREELPLRSPTHAPGGASPPTQAKGAPDALSRSPAFPNRLKPTLTHV